MERILRCPTAYVIRISFLLTPLGFSFEKCKSPSASSKIRVKGIISLVTPIDLSQNVTLLSICRGFSFIDIFWLKFNSILSFWFWGRGVISIIFKKSSIWFSSNGLKITLPIIPFSIFLISSLSSIIVPHSLFNLKALFVKFAEVIIAFELPIEYLEYKFFHVMNFQ